MAEDWSPEEVAATVADYLAMLAHELRGEPYNKAEHNRQLQPLLRGRSAQAVEFKHANISAVLRELGIPFIDGYKPRANYQGLLVEEVVTQFDSDRSLVSLVEFAVAKPVENAPLVRSLDDIIVQAPVREVRRAYERRELPLPPRRDIDYLEREARNSSLGLAGEAFVLTVEHRRLWEAGKRQLAERIEHVSKTRGDGLGYDILSFDTDGRERLIEVKTTGFGAMTPFYASKREVAISAERAPSFSLYRVFRFRNQPRIFTLPGSLRESCILDPVQFRASLP